MHGANFSSSGRQFKNQSFADAKITRIQELPRGMGQDQKRASGCSGSFSKLAPGQI
jgi:hypothetical protein